MVTTPYKRGKGFRQTGTLVQARVRQASEGRGFAVSRLLTRWEDVAGPDLAPICRPLGVRYGRGLGATLTVYTTGPNAPILQMQKDSLRDRVNACYGYNAISKIVITQTAPDGLDLRLDKAQPAPRAPSAAARAKASGLTDGVSDERLRMALNDLAAQIITRSDAPKGTA